MTRVHPSRIVQRDERQIHRSRDRCAGPPAQHCIVSTAPVAPVTRLQRRAAGRPFLQQPVVAAQTAFDAAPGGFQQTGRQSARSQKVRTRDDLAFLAQGAQAIVHPTPIGRDSLTLVRPALIRIRQRTRPRHSDPSRGAQRPRRLRHPAASLRKTPVRPHRTACRSRAPANNRPGSPQPTRRADKYFYPIGIFPLRTQRFLSHLFRSTAPARRLSSQSRHGPGQRRRDGAPTCRRVPAYQRRESTCTGMVCSAKR